VSGRALITELEMFPHCKENGDIYFVMGYKKCCGFEKEGLHRRGLLGGRNILSSAIPMLNPSEDLDCVSWR
jgi:hypothetical protein